MSAVLELWENKAGSCLMLRELGGQRLMCLKEQVFIQTPQHTISRFLHLTHTYIPGTLTNHSRSHWILARNEWIFPSCSSTKWGLFWNQAWYSPSFFKYVGFFFIWDGWETSLGRVPTPKESVSETKGVPMSDRICESLWSRLQAAWHWSRWHVGWVEGKAMWEEELTGLNLP